MKTKLISILLYFILSVNLYGFDDCGAVQHCPANKKYPYKACNGSTICTSDPLSYQGLPELRKTPYPICVKLSSDPRKQGPLNVKMPDINNETGFHEVEIYNLNDLSNPNIGDIDCAENVWKCVCGTQEWECECEIDIVFSSRNTDWGNPKTELAIAWGVISKTQDGNYCSDLFCNHNSPSSFIQFNKTDEFKRIRNGKVTRFFYNNSNWADVQNVISANEPNEFQTYNFCDVLTHEIGHMYGLMHFDEFCTSEGNVGIMDSKVTANIPKEGLSNDDKCAFMKLYCNTLVPVNDYTVMTNEVTSFPNPINTRFNVKFAVRGDNKIVKIQIFNVSGKYINEVYNDNLSNGIHTIPLNISYLSDGIYFYKIIIGTEVIIEKFVIST